ncbi:EBSC protein [Fusobacterium necrophorum BFTR-1]|uniref:YbaK/EbsC family protein n=1 Tax=Fusobacterium necrophorum TaxID=859 RepID=UPI000461C066|nr:YbaK/EbsC family protein [Fusobacterium necrophorum]KDE61336.1 EBSC protein [Fusobacterium necrophorum BFTR-1]
MSIEAVKKHLETFGLQDRIKEFKESTATVEEAAMVNSCEPARIAKSLSFLIKDIPTIIVVAGDAKINNQKFKATFKTKAKMIAGNDVETLIGHPIGGVCPFAVKDNVKVYLDASMKRFRTMLPACGTPNSAIELTLEELEKASNYIEWVDVCQI